MQNLDQAKWIGCAEHRHRNDAPIFRKEFFIEKFPDKAVLTICGLGYHDAHLNGRPVTQDKLTPAFTHYDHRVFVSEYDITQLLGLGKNVLSVELGRGFYAMNTPNVWEHEKASWHDEPKLICSIAVQSEDQWTHIVNSDESFRTRLGATTRCCLYTGETVDGEILEKLGEWKEPDYDDSSFQSAVVVPAPLGRCMPAQGVPIRVVDQFSPVRIERINAQLQRVTFPYNISGWCRIRATGKPGTLLRMRYGEKLKDGRIVLDQSFVEGELQTDEYRFGQSGKMDFEPKFSYKGFQYVELEGEIEDLSAEDITAFWVVSDLQQTGSFTCSEPLINQMVDAVRRTIRNNMHSIPTDTPIYEKNGWTGDIGLVFESAMLLMDMTPLFDKWITDVADSMCENGQVSLLAPETRWGFWKNAPEWIDAVYEIVWQMYRFSGDEEILQRHYPTLKKIAAYQCAALEENGLPDSPLGDWIPPGMDQRGPEGAGVTAPCFLIKSLRGLRDMAQVLHHTQEAQEFERRAEQFKTRLNEVYFDEQTGQYRLPCQEYRQVIDVVTLYFDLMPKAAQQKAFDRLVQDIVDRDYHLNTGIIGTKYLMLLLTERGRHDLAWHLAVQDTYPSWGYWFRHGVNTFLEAWEMQARSYNHFMYGSVVGWIVQYLAGFRLGKNLQEMIIAPRPVGTLHSCHYAFQTKAGQCLIDWHLQEGEFLLDVVIPQGVTVSVELPNGERFEKAVSGRYQCRL